MKQTPTHKYNERISLQSFTLAKSSSGQPTKTWSTYATVWACIETMGGGEKVFNQLKAGVMSMKVTIRYSSDVSGVGVSDRLLHGSNYYDIKDIRNVDFKNEEIKMLCTQSV